MNLLSVYHRLPATLRNWVASARGWSLRRVRYGPETDRLVDEALMADRLPLAELDRRRSEALAATLLHASQAVPYYRRWWSSAAARGRDPARFDDWPVLEKETVRESPEAFLSDECDRSSLVPEHTSGTTGKPLRLWWSRQATLRHYALFEARWRRWYGVSRHDRWAILGGQLVAAVASTKPPFWVWNAPLNQLYMSSYHLSQRWTPHYLDALRRYDIKYVWGYSSSLFALACDALATGRRDLRFTVAVANAEPLLPHQRDIIGRAFQCPVRETYGMAELVAAASECEAGKLHLWPETGVVEVLDGESRVPPGQSGELICTGLLNDAMPLIRYRIGDRGALDDDPTPCACGRTLPRLKFIGGRNDDVLYTADGRRIGRLDTVFKTDWPIREAQIVQERLDFVRLRYVPAAGYDSAVGDEMVAALRRRLGNVRVELEATDAIERTSNGKFRGVVCRLPLEERKRLTRGGPISE